MQIVFRGPFYEMTEEGIAVRALAAALDDLSMDVKVDIVGERTDGLDLEVAQRLQRLELRPSNSDQVLLDARPSPSYQEHSGQYLCRVVLPLSYESMSIGAKMSHRYEAAVVPSGFVQQVYLDKGFRAPIHVVPIGVNMDHLTPDVYLLRSGEPKGMFVFQSVLNDDWYRQGADILFQAYLEEFSSNEPVTLVIKSQDLVAVQDLVQQHEMSMRDLGKQNLPDVRVQAFTGTDGEFANADCFVLPARYDSMCISVLESMSCGIPVITTGWGSALEILGPQSGYLIPFMLQPPADSDKYVEPLWPEPDKGTLRTVLRRVTLYQHEARRKGERARIDSMSRSWGECASKIRAVIDEILVAPSR